ncbi:hypothetical protein TcasGA2_TC015962 [Tribolium castaneum]|uniref:Uncharacterized protein n=1 Tax=Tribolium castaneum TaxID=7070 RepID=D7GY84_TRICA|nr:hypothetical protein TcasGA2_TC012985 [Tribolium castaneum]EFA13416.1 hypothetical protein TcasGA2_TC015962 [Tribolium castaneum]
MVDGHRVKSLRSEDVSVYLKTFTDAYRSLIAG